MGILCDVEEMQSFYNALKHQWDMRCADDLLMCFCDFNEHIGFYFDGVYGRYGVVQRNLEF